MTDLKLPDLNTNIYSFKAGDVVVIVHPYDGEQKIAGYLYVIVGNPPPTMYGTYIKRVGAGQREYMHWRQLALACALPDMDEDES